MYFIFEGAAKTALEIGETKDKKIALLFWGNRVRKCGWNRARSGGAHRKLNAAEVEGSRRRPPLRSAALISAALIGLRRPKRDRLLFVLTFKEIFGMTVDNKRKRMKDRVKFPWVTQWRERLRF